MTSGKTSPADSTPNFDWLHNQENETEETGPALNDNAPSDAVESRSEEAAADEPTPTESESPGTDSVFSASSTVDDERSASALDDDDDVGDRAPEVADIGSNKTRVMEQRFEPPAEPAEAQADTPAETPGASGTTGDGPDFSNWESGAEPVEAAEFNFDAASSTPQSPVEEPAPAEPEQPTAETPQAEEESAVPATPSAEPAAASDGPDFSKWGSGGESTAAAEFNFSAAPPPTQPVDDEAAPVPDQAALPETPAVEETAKLEEPTPSEPEAADAAEPVKEPAAAASDGPDFSNWGASTAANDEPPAFSPQEDAPAPLFDPNAAPVAAAPKQPEPPAEEAPPEPATTESKEAKSEANTTTTSKNPTTTKAKPASGEGEGRSQLLWLVLISYASAITLALLFLLFRDATSKPQPHQLESLPDVAPLEEGQFLHYPVDAPLPPGHVLPLGEKQRLGNIEIEPLRVTKEPVEFVHYSGNTKKQKPASGEVLKLWLRLTNVSQDQQIAPLDAELLFTRKLTSDGRLVANNFVYREEDKDENGPFVYVFDHPLTSDWDLAGQQLGHVLQPGESIEVFIPSDEAGLAQLSGECLWRIQLRKGYSPAGYGVTTLVDVAFSTDEVKSPGA